MRSKVERQERRAARRAADTHAGKRPIASNRRALHEYHVEEKFEAGVVLTGTEVKSLRAGQASLADGYVAVEQGEAWLFNVHVAPYEAGSYNNAESKRKRKLLLHKREIGKIAAKIQRTGATCVPLSLYFFGPRVKTEIALVTGKKLHDKRETLRSRELERESRAAIRSRGR